MSEQELQKLKKLQEMQEMQKLQEQVAEGSCDRFFIAAEAPLPNDPGRKIIVVEKLPAPEAQPAETTKESKEEEEDDNFVQIRSPTSREKISIMAVIDRCRAYQDSDEYQLREEAKAKAEAARPPEQDDGPQKTEAGQQSMVKNLREKFQSLN